MPTNYGVGDAIDEAHGCDRAAGYGWCAAEGRCVLPEEIAAAKGFAKGTPMSLFAAYCEGPPVGADTGPACPNGQYARSSDGQCVDNPSWGSTILAWGVLGVFGYGIYSLIKRK